MRTQTVAALAAILAPIATFAAGSTATKRVGKRVRIYRPELSLQWTPEVNAAVKLILEAGHKVRVYEGGVIYHPTMVADTVVWERNDARRDRDYTVVEVEL